MVKHLAYDLDTVVVSAKEENYRQIFISENHWYAIRISDVMLPRIQYLAIYRSAPVSAITHIVRVKSIRPWQRTDKYELIFDGTPIAIGPISLVKGGSIMAPFGPRYTSRQRLLAAKNLDEVW